MQRDNESRYILTYFAAVVMFALGGAFVRYSLLPAGNTGFYRMLLTVVLLLPLVWRELHTISRRDFWLLMLGGLFTGTNLWLWNYALVATTQANANLLANLHIIVTAPISCLLYHERLRKNFFFGVVVAVAGLVLLMLGKADPQPGYFIGDAAALLTAGLYGGFLMVTYAVRDRCSTLCTLFIPSLGSLFFLLPIMALTEGVYIPLSWAEWWPLLAITFVGQGGVFLVNFCLGKIQVSLASVLSLTQPAAAALFALLLFNERLSWMEIGGICIISAGVYVAQLKSAAPAAAPAAE